MVCECKREEVNVHVDGNETEYLISICSFSATRSACTRIQGTENMSFFTDITFAV